MAEYFPHPVGAVLPGHTVAHLYEASPGVTFTPYDGLEQALPESFLGFHTLQFSTGELFPETRPAPSAAITEIRLTGDSIDPEVMNHLSRAFPHARYTDRCVRTTGADLHIWEAPHGGVGAELMVPRTGRSGGRLRIFRGDWRGGPLTRESVPGRCRGS